jgi:iron complex outermembrane receptor protein
MTGTDYFARTALLAGTAMALVATPAFAQDTASASAETTAAVQNDVALPADGDAVVVTARRRSETLVDVPIAVTAYSGAALERLGSTDITDLADTTPNVTLEPSRGTNSTLTAFIRGVGQQDPVAGFEQGVGLYLDDVYLNRPQAAVLDIYDVERIEVLRGPQGTLYGRNTIGGAIKYVTRRLSDTPRGKIKLNAGTYRQIDVIGSASTPIAEGLRIGASVARLTRKGFGDNLTTGEENYDKNIWAVRGTLEAEPSTDAFLRLSGDYTWDKSSARGGHRLIPSLITQAPVLEDVYDTRGGLLDPKQKVTGGGLALSGEFGVAEGIKVRSITAYRKDNSATPIDFDALPSADLDVPAIYKNRQLSQEAQILINRGRLNGLIGAYYLDAHALTQFDVRLFTTLAGLAAFTSSTIDTRTVALFGDFSYDLTDQLSLSVGGRYTWDRRDGKIFRQNYTGGGSPVFGGLGTPFGATSTNFDGSRRFKKFTPRASLSFKPAENQNLYVSYSEGFKGGGFDPRGVGANAPDLNGDGRRGQDEIAAFIGFNPETVKSYEAGYKASLFDRRLSFATAVFRANYSDVQIPGSVPCTVNGLPSFCGQTANAGKARFQGVELESSAIVARNLSGAGDRLNLSGTLGYIDAKFLSYESLIAGKPTDVADFRKVQNTPKWTASGSIDYSRPLGGGSLNVNSTLSYRSKTYQFEVPNPFFDQKGYALLDAGVVWTSADDHLTIGLYGKNLTDKQYKTSGYTFLAANPTTGELLRGSSGNFISGTGREGTLTAFYGNPRQVFVSLGYKF